MALINNLSYFRRIPPTLRCVKDSHMYDPKIKQPIESTDFTYMALVYDQMNITC